MSDQPKRVIVDGVEFSQLFQFPRILSSAVWALQPGRLVVGLLMVLTVLTAGGIWDASTTHAVHPAGLHAGPYGEREAAAAEVVYAGALRRFDPDAQVEMDAQVVRDAVVAGYRSGLADLAEEARADREAELAATLERIEQVRARGIFEASADHVADCFARLVAGTLGLQPTEAWSGLVDLIVGTPTALWDDHRAFVIVFALLGLVLWAVGGGALSRMEAARAGGQERLGVAGACDFAFRRWVRLIVTTVLPLLLAALLVVVIALAGWLLMLPGLDLLGGLAYGLALLAGLGVVFLLVGYAAGFVMLVPAVACEDCDAADAQQRAFAYVLSRPLHLVGYGAVALVGLALGYLIVGGGAVLVLNGTASLVGLLSASPALDAAGGFELYDLGQRGSGAAVESWHGRWAAGAITLWQTVVTSLVAAYVLSYLFAATTSIYLLMRRACDGQSTDEIWYPGLVGGTFVPQEDAGDGD